MIIDRCRLMASSFVVLALAFGQASAEEVSGKVKSVDVEGKKVVITETATAKDHEIAIDSSTAWTKEKKGKTSKKFDLAKLKVGSEVVVTSEGTHASKILIKPGKKKKDKAA